MPIIKSNEFSVAVSHILSDYATDVQEAVAQAVEETGERALKIVRDKSPVRKGKGGGKYKKGWKKKIEHAGIFSTQSRVIIYNKDEYRLVHLLENGHQITRYPDSPGGRAMYGYQKVVGGRVEGIPHVRPAYEEAERLLPELTARAIEEAGGK